MNKYFTEKNLRLEYDKELSILLDDIDTISFVSKNNICELLIKAIQNLGYNVPHETLTKIFENQIIMNDKTEIIRFIYKSLQNEDLIRL